MNTKQMYCQFLKVNGRVSFTHGQFKKCLENQGNKCSICGVNFNAFSGYPSVLGIADSIVCGKCLNSLHLMGWDISNLAKAITVLKKLERKSIQ